MTSNSLIKGDTIPSLIKYKIVFLGDQAVGKSSIINRFIYDIFQGGQHRPTIGIDFISQNIFLEERTIRLQLWDTAGQQRFRALIPNYIRDSAVAVIVYDVNNRTSFEKVQKWINDVKNQRGQQVIIALLANKIDLEQRQIQQNDGNQLAQRNGIIFREVSAKTGSGIQQFFKDIASLLPEIPMQSGRSKIDQQERKRTNSKSIILSKKISQQIKSNSKKKKCC